MYLQHIVDASEREFYFPIFFPFFVNLDEISCPYRKRYSIYTYSLDVDTDFTGVNLGT